MRRDLKVGLIGLAGLILLVMLVWYFYYIWNTYLLYADFDKASGIKMYGDVSMSGFRIGSVRDISLARDRRVHVVMLIKNRYKDFIPRDSIAKIIPGIISTGGKSVVDITPGRSAMMLHSEEYIVTREIPELQDLVARSGMLIGTMQTSFTALDDLLGDPDMRRSIRNSALSMENASKRSVVLIGDLQGVVSASRTQIPRTLSSMDVTASNFESLSRDLRQMAAVNRPVLKQTAADVSKSAQDFRAVSKGLRLVVESTNPDDIRQMLENTKVTAENLHVVSTHLRKLSEDPALSAQSKEMFKNLQKALSGAADVVDQVQKLLQKGASSTPPTPPAGLNLKPAP